MFFKDERGFRYPTSRIQQIGIDHRQWQYKNREQPKTVSVSLTDGDEVEISFAEFDRIINLSTQIITAQPGNYLLNYDPEDEEIAIFKTQIIGWSISPDAPATPITVDGLNDGVTEPGLILTSDGKVTEQGSQSWDDLERFVDEKRADALASRLRIAKTA